MNDKQQPAPDIPERLFAKACHPERPNQNCSWSVSKEPVQGSIPYARVHPLKSGPDERLAEIRERWVNVSTMGVGIWEQGDSLYEESEPHRTVGHLHGQISRDTAIALSKSKTDIDYLLSLHCRSGSLCSECGRPAYLKGSAAEASKFIREMLEGEALTAIEPYLEDLERTASQLQQPPPEKEVV